ncbi:MAG: glycosyltransferase, partial [Polyangiales bacterium]
LTELSVAHVSVSALRLPHNQGKAEAVRQGMLQAWQSHASWLGYADADMATPPEELIRLLHVATQQASYDGVLGSRVRRAGAQVERQVHRHYLGRVFATAASIALGTPFYDTQCGAKFFRRTPRLQQALARPFRSRWAFDVELLERLLYPDSEASPARFLEVPLQKWVDVRGSKLRPRDMMAAGVELAGILCTARNMGRSR